MAFDTDGIVWKPSDAFIEKSNLNVYKRWLQENKNLNLNSYAELHTWSVNNIEDFWHSLWEFFSIKHSGEVKTVLDSKDMPGCEWFKGCTLNYAEHIFRNKNTAKPAFYYATEEADPVPVSWNELEIKVSKISTYLKQKGVKQGDRICAYLPNGPEAVIAFLAANALGAVWSCCSPDFGVDTVIDRFEQIEPACLILCDGYTYNGKQISRTAESVSIYNRLNSVSSVIYVQNYEDEIPSDLPATSWDTALTTKPGTLTFERVPFSHPIWILYSSGTTGKPKAITHSHGGVLLEHLKYLYLHNDVKRGEHFFWYTTTGWMMWNFLQASMLTGGIPLFYDGSAGFPDLSRLWSLAESLPIHHFGTSAPYLVACMKSDKLSAQSFSLEHLRSIGSTGAPLPPEAFDWVYAHLSEDVWLCSMSGGTDVCTAFVGGNPFEPVKRGKIQCRALGCDLHAYSEAGTKITGSLGEMVIEQPMPSMPIYFWNDEDYARYKQSYFQTFEGKWCHGDWIQIFEDGQLIILGRSDATLNRKGVRIGTAEIYAVTDRIDGIKDSLIVNIERNDGSDFMPLFVVIDNSISDDKAALFQKIKTELRSRCSPRHIPDEIIQVSDIPYTLSGKKMEIPVKKILMGMSSGSSMNEDAVRNPEALRFFEKFKDQLADELL